MTLLMALYIFLQERCDVVILEVGIGGEFDATNFVRRPVACGITSLHVEHADELGNTVGEIAWHKSGIAKVSCHDNNPAGVDVCAYDTLSLALPAQVPTATSTQARRGELRRAGKARSTPPKVDDLQEKNLGETIAERAWHGSGVAKVSALSVSAFLPLSSFLPSFLNPTTHSPATHYWWAVFSVLTVQSRSFPSIDIFCQGI